jgi:MFS family permease
MKLDKRNLSFFYRHLAATGWTIFTLLTPSAAKLGLNYLLLCRILLGIAEGACFPSVHSLIASWAPLEERSRTVAIITSANLFGSIIAFPVSTWLGSGPWGWESIFWTFGAVGVIWSLIWQIYGGSDPSTYPGISKEELDLILKNSHKSGSRSCYTSLPTSEEEMYRSNEGDIDVAEDDDNNDLISEEIDNSFTTIKNSNHSHIPWRLIFSRREVWAIIGKIFRYLPNFLYKRKIVIFRGFFMGLNFITKKALMFSTLGVSSYCSIGFLLITWIILELI